MFVWMFFIIVYIFARKMSEIIFGRKIPILGRFNFARYPAQTEKR